MKMYKNARAKYALMSCYANTLLTDDTGAIPDQTALIGTPLTAGSSYASHSYTAISKFKCIDYASGSAGILQVKFCF
jgi:hypothetical protein